MITILRFDHLPEKIEILIFGRKNPCLFVLFVCLLQYFVRFWLTLTTRICARLGLRMKFKTLFMSDEEKNGHHFDLPLFVNISKQFLAPGGLSAECVQVGVM